MPLRLTKLLRTSALPFVLCFAPVLVFGAIVNVWPGSSPASLTGTTWFEKLYVAGKNRMGLRPAGTPSPAEEQPGTAGSRPPASDTTPVRVDPPSAQAAPQSAAQRADEIARKAIQDAFGIDVPIDAISGRGIDNTPVPLTDVQRKKLEDILAYLTPRTKVVNDSLGTCYVQWNALHPPGNEQAYTNLIITIDRDGAREYTVIDQPREGSTPHGPVDAATHNPFSVDRLPKQPTERRVVLSSEKAKAYVAELKGLWREMHAREPEQWPRQLDDLEAIGSRIWFDKATAGDLLTIQQTFQRFPEVRDFALDQRRRVIRLVTLFAELGYKSEVPDDRLYPAALSEAEVALAQEADENRRLEKQKRGDASQQGRSQGGTALSVDAVTPALAGLMDQEHERAEAARLERERARRIQEAATGVGVRATAEQAEALRAQLQNILDALENRDKPKAGRLARELLPDTTRLKAILDTTVDPTLRDLLESYYRNVARSRDVELASPYASSEAGARATVNALTFRELEATFPDKNFVGMFRQDAPLATVLVRPAARAESASDASLSVFFWDGTRWNYLDLNLIPWPKKAR